MKPRIQLARYWPGGYRWQCVGEGRYGVGDTPHAAYLRWALRVRAPRKPGW